MAILIVAAFPSRLSRYIRRATSGIAGLRGRCVLRNLRLQRKSASSPFPHVHGADLEGRKGSRAVGRGLPAYGWREAKCAAISGSRSNRNALDLVQTGPSSLSGADEFELTEKRREGD